MSAIIELKNITKSYGEKIVFKDFNLNIENGEFLTVLGSSGCGKTTLLKMINGLVLPDDGEVVVEGSSLSHLNLINLRRGIGYCIQGSMLFPHLSVKDNINFVYKIAGGEKRTRKKENEVTVELLESVGLSGEIINRYPSELSGGEQQRVGILRAIASNPSILLMDEPFGAVDEITRKGLQKLIKDIHLKTKTTIVFITHDKDEALLLGTKVLILNNGMIEQYDTPENIIKKPKTEFVKDFID